MYYVRASQLAVLGVRHMIPRNVRHVGHGVRMIYRINMWFVGSGICTFRDKENNKIK